MRIIRKEKGIINGKIDYSCFSEIFLNIFKEDGVSKEELENAICESYRKEGIKCDTIKDIPIKEMKEAITECCEAAGLAFETFDDILDFFYKNY